MCVCGKKRKKRSKTIKLLEENIREKLHVIGLDNNFTDTIRKAQATEVKLDNWDYIKLKSFAQQRKQSTE